jgi:hypothetical protein
MKRKLTAIGLTLAAATVLAASSPNNTILIDNFNSGNAAGWDHNDFTGVGIFDASSGSYLIESTVPIAIDDPSVGTIESHYKRSLELPRFANGKIRCTVRANTYGTTVGFLIRDNENTESDYGFYGSTSFGTFYIERFEFDKNPDAPQTIIAMAAPEEFPFVAGETYILEGSVVGKQVTLKAWKVGDPEPPKPILSVTDKVLKPGAGNRISVLIFFDPVPLSDAGVAQVQVSGTFDDIYFTPGAGK